LVPTLLIRDSDADEGADDDSDAEPEDEDDEDDEVEESDPDLTLNDLAGTHPGGQGFDLERLVLLR